ncbi:MAG: hypothetical protein PHH26_00440 [Candidatus Thermoplasmatota archaeon]|nr:hypothetical protein [Candidatus Thermoplasmatota archaeon]
MEKDSYVAIIAVLAILLALTLAGYLSWDWIVEKLASVGINI